MVHLGLPPARVIPYIKGINFPVNKENMIKHARNKNADYEVIDTLNLLPNQEFGSTKELKRVPGNVQRQF